MGPVTDFMLFAPIFGQSGLRLYSSLELGNGSTAIDIGANIGTVSITIANIFPQVRFVAYEPSPQNFAFLKANVEMNNLTNRVTAVNKAVTGDGRDVQVCTCDFDSGYEPFPGAPCWTALSTTIDSLLVSHNLTRGVSLLKIDCEGCEYEGGFPDLILDTGFFSNLIGECHDHSNETLRDVICERFKAMEKGLT